jgi:SAM-dependent methyltransferase
MKLLYEPAYWENYYGGTYEDTFQYAFPLDRVLSVYWDKVFKYPPRSFADVGCGPGHTLCVAERLLPGATPLWGIEVQELPQWKHRGVVCGDFMEMSERLEPVDLLYCSCSMYIPWADQERFISECLRLAKRAVVFANVYLSDKEGIPEDMHRKVIYKDRDSFAKAIGRYAGWQKMPGFYDFYYKGAG